VLCPSCKTPLSIADRSGIEIDFCPTCRGVWLDRGELDKIIERAAAFASPPEAPAAPSYPPQTHHPAPQYGHGHHAPQHGYGYRGKRKKSFLSEIFDFD
jgi:Zn-finger nucleic acid-binding protein